MPYCPQCLTEYVVGSRECIDCHVALRPGGPLDREAGESKVKLLRVRTFSGPTAHMHAELARSILGLAKAPMVRARSAKGSLGDVCVCEALSDAKAGGGDRNLKSIG
jgi:hypothetical protein